VAEAELSGAPPGATTGGHVSMLGHSGRAPLPVRHPSHWLPRSGAERTSVQNVALTSVLQQLTQQALPEVAASAGFGDRAGAGRDAELGEHAGEVGLDGGLADVEAAGYGGVVVAVGDRDEHVDLAG